MTSVKATALNASSVDVIWIPAIKEECVHHYLACITHLTSLVQECHNDTDVRQIFTVSLNQLLNTVDNGLLHIYVILW